MNLLNDNWIPIRKNRKFLHVNLQQLLCSDDEVHLSLPRDDMEVAALQLLICLVQSILAPDNVEMLRSRVDKSLDDSEYHDAITDYMDWFQLDHEHTPFMQTLGVNAKDLTPIQKLFVGLPEGNNHAFFNQPGEIQKSCTACTAVVLFNQASNCPSFGGGFKGSLRGSAPVNTFIAGQSLRETIWLNVLHKNNISLWQQDTSNNKPVWVDTIKSKENIPANRIGLLRGLFWQPMRVEVIWNHGKEICDFCCCETQQYSRGFKKEKFVYDIEGQWEHPHGPKIWDIKKAAKDRERYLSFTTTAPAWTQLNHYMINVEQKKTASEPSAVVSQYSQTFHRGKPILIVSGYRNNQAAILERRHETFSMPLEWSNGAMHIEKMLVFALQVKSELRNKLYGFSKDTGANIHEKSEGMFYYSVESLVHQLLRDIAYREGKQEVENFKQQVITLARSIFDELTLPYQHIVAKYHTYVRFKRSFESAVYKLSHS